MMRQMRENTKWIMMVTALAFVALMVFEWGMDLTGRSSGGLGEIGRVNGQPVMYEQYLATYRNLYDEVQRGQGQAISSQQNREIEDSAWEQLVTRILIEQELERRGIDVTAEEIREAALYSPPPAFMDAPEFRTDGVFDLAKYQGFIRSPQVDDQTLLYLESYYRDVIPRGKLLRQLTSGIFPSDGELWKLWQDENERVTVNYIPLDPATRIPDADVPVTDREIQAYYDRNAGDFSTPAQATVKFVMLSKQAGAADTVAAMERAMDLRQEIQEGTSFAEVAVRVSADSASGRDGGLLGTLERGRMVAPLEEAAFSAPVGQVTEPVQTAFGFHLVQVDRRTADSVTLRHILVPIERTDEAEFRLLILADSLERLSGRQSLEAAAAVIGLEVETLTLTTLFPFVAGAGRLSEGLDWAIEDATRGEASPLFETSEAFYLMELVQASPAGILPLAEARSTIERILMTEKKTAKVIAEGKEMSAKIRAGQSMNAVAAEHGLDVGGAGPFTRVDFVPSLGTLNAAIGASFGLEVGGVSDPVAASSNVFILQQVSRTPADSAAWLEQKDVQREIVASQAQERRMEGWVEGIRARAKVVDRRSEVLQPIEDDPARRSLPGPFGR